MSRTYSLPSSETISFHLILTFSSSALSNQPSPRALVVPASQPPGHTVYKKGLEEMGLLTPKQNKERRHLNELLAVFNCLLGGSGGTEPNSFCGAQLQHQQHELQHEKFQLNHRKNAFIIVKQQNGFPREAVALPPLKTQLGKVLSNLVKLILL